MALCMCMIVHEMKQLSIEKCLYLRPIIHVYVYCFHCAYCTCCGFYISIQYSVLPVIFHPHILVSTDMDQQSKTIHMHCCTYDRVVLHSRDLCHQRSLYRQGPSVMYVYAFHYCTSLLLLLSCVCIPSTQILLLLSYCWCVMCVI